MKSPKCCVAGPWLDTCSKFRFIQHHVERDRLALEVAAAKPLGEPIPPESATDRSSGATKVGVSRMPRGVLLDRNRGGRQPPLSTGDSCPKEWHPPYVTLTKCRDPIWPRSYSRTISRISRSRTVGLSGISFFVGCGFIAHLVMSIGPTHARPRCMDGVRQRLPYGNFRLERFRPTVGTHVTTSTVVFRAGRVAGIDARTGDE